MKRALIILAVLWSVLIMTGTVRDGSFWNTPDRRGDALMGEGKFAEAARTYSDPWRIGIAQYRNGDFKEAAATLARAPGAAGAFDQGNALLMHGAYDAAVASYDRALSMRPGWKEAAENKALALARKARIEGSAKDRDKETTDAYTPDKIVMDLKPGENKKAEPETLNEGDMSDAELRATWLRRVQTTPGDFLRAKFAFQTARKAERETLSHGKEDAK